MPSCSTASYVLHLVSKPNSLYQNRFWVVVCSSMGGATRPKSIYLYPCYNGIAKTLPSLAHTLTNLPPLKTEWQAKWKFKENCFDCAWLSVLCQKKWQTDMRTHPLKSMASGPLKIEKGTRPVLILATHCHTTESVSLNTCYLFEESLVRLEG